MIEISPSIKIDESEIQYDFIRASGPGGQNVNKVASSVQLRFDVRNSLSLEPEVKERLIKLAGRRVTGEGILIIEAKKYRTQEQNRIDATRRLITWIQKALAKPKARTATQPGHAARAARMDAKKKRAATKQTRRTTPEEWE